MPVFFQQNINATTRLGIWKIEEDEDFFKQKVTEHRDVSHPHKRLQHLAGRYLLQFLFPNFPSHLIQIADTRKPFLPDEAYHFSISHCGDYAAAIVSSTHRVGIDIEIPIDKVQRISHKFISEHEADIINPLTLDEYTQIWSAKEAVFKWYGLGKVDFKQHIQLLSYNDERSAFNCRFIKDDALLKIYIKNFENLCLSYVYSK